MNYISQTLQTENLQFVRETLRSSEGVPPKSAVNAKCKYLCNRNKRAIAFWYRGTTQDDRDGLDASEISRMEGKRF